MKKNITNSIIIYLILIYILININPPYIYQSDGITLKRWQDIDISNTETLHNIYIYCICIAFVSYYIANEL